MGNYNLQREIEERGQIRERRKERASRERLRGFYFRFILTTSNYVYIRLCN